MIFVPWLPTKPFNFYDVLNNMKIVEVVGTGKWFMCFNLISTMFCFFEVVLILFSLLLTFPQLVIMLINTD